MKNIFDLSKEKIIITAEIGINHNGDPVLAGEMIDAAAQCGVDAVKFQTFKTEDMYSRLTPGFAHTEQDVFSQIQALELSEECWPNLRKQAQKQKLFFSASVFDRRSLETIKAVGLDFVKVASSEIDNLEFLAEQKVLSEIFVVSTGMAYLEEIAAAVRFLRETGITKMILLECTSSYPAPPESIHLLNMDFLANTFRLPVGFSDHTIGFHHAAAAAARGARFIEKHFTLDKNMKGPDHRISSDVAEMKRLVQAVREIEVSLKCSGKTEISSFEKETRAIGRKSVIAARRIKKGEMITSDNTVIKRPGLGVSPREARFLYGRKAAAEIEPDRWITWEMVE
jgi:N,N'-diacetyllegionaminate synthase